MSLYTVIALDIVPEYILSLTYVIVLDIVLCLLLSL